MWVTDDNQVVNNEKRMYISCFGPNVTLQKELAESVTSLLNAADEMVRRAKEDSDDIPS